MQKVLDSNIQRLLRRFFLPKCLVLLALSIFFSVCSVVLADSDGTLKLNTDILTKNQVKTVGVGEFPIRGELFTTAITELTDRNKNEQEVLVDKARHVDLAHQKKQNSDEFGVKKLLFQGYQPQVLMVNGVEKSEETSFLVWLSVPLCLGLLGVGMLAGRWRVKQKRKIKSEKIRQ